LAVRVAGAATVSAGPPVGPRLRRYLARQPATGQRPVCPSADAGRLLP
jgi:hypothetical protein